MGEKLEIFSHPKIPPNGNGSEAQVFHPSIIHPKKRWEWSARLSPSEKSLQTAMGLKHEVFSHCKNPLWKVMEAKREYFSHQKIPPSSDGYEARVFLPSKNPPFEGWVWSASISPIEKSPQKVMEAKREYFSHQKIPKVMGAKREFFSHRWLIGSLFAPILLVNWITIMITT